MEIFNDLFLCFNRINKLIESLGEDRKPEEANKALRSVSQVFKDVNEKGAANSDEVNFSHQKISSILEETIDLLAHINLTKSEREQLFSIKSELESLKLKDTNKYFSKYSFPYDNPFLDTENENLKNSLRDAELKYRDIESRIPSIKNQLSSVKGRIDSIDEELEKKKTDFDAIFEKTENDLKEKEESLNGLLEKISERVMAGDYDETASNQYETANKLRAQAFSLMVVMVVIACYGVYETSSVDFDIYKAIYKFALLAVISVPAAYLAKEADKHRKHSDSNLKKALDLKALGPFVAGLPEEKQIEIKMEAAKKLFFGSVPPEENEYESSISIAKKIVELAAKIARNKN